MNVEIGAEAAQFAEKEYINGIAVAVYCLSIWLKSSLIFLFLLLQVNGNQLEISASRSPDEGKVAGNFCFSLSSWSESSTRFLLLVLKMQRKLHEIAALVLKRFRFFSQWGSSTRTSFMTAARDFRQFNKFWETQKLNGNKYPPCCFFKNCELTLRTINKQHLP